jgi:hypothetical protein
MSSQPDPYSHMSFEKKSEADEKIRQFEEFINKRANEINNSQNEEYDTEEINLTESSGKTKKILYFIGRLNPPHNGHIAALEQLTRMAKKDNSVPLILLGSGPKQTNGDKRTMDNPITFETKKQLIESKLNGVEGTDYIIQEMTNPAQDISNYISEQVGNSSDLQDIQITHIAGGKDEDASKLLFALKSAEKKATSLAPNAKVTASVAAIESEITDTGSAMSATQVRKDAYKTIINDNGFEEWNNKYGTFYGPMSQQIYKEILDPITKYGVTKIQIQEYINYGTLPSNPSTKRRKNNGGSTKRTNKRKTQRRKTQRRKTHRRKTHRRRH